MIDLLRTRRSIRRYEKKALDRRSVEILKEAMLRCPSSRGIRPWTFIFVDDPELLAQLSRAREDGSSFLKGAALGIVVCGDETMSDAWVEDCTITSIVAQLTAHSLGLGNCWIQIRMRRHSERKTAGEYVQELLGIPKNLNVESIVSIGFPAETKRPVSAKELDYRKVKHNRYEENF
jgi:nitroreductase